MVCHYLGLMEKEVPKGGREAWRDVKEGMYCPGCIPTVEVQETLTNRRKELQGVENQEQDLEENEARSHLYYHLGCLEPATVFLLSSVL